MQVRFQNRRGLKWVPVWCAITERVAEEGALEDRGLVEGGLAARGGQVQVFGRRWLEWTVRMAENWTSPLWTSPLWALMFLSVPAVAQPPLVFPTTPAPAASPAVADGGWDDDSWADVEEEIDTDAAFGEVSTPDAPETPSKQKLEPHPWKPPAPPSEAIRLKDAPEGSRTFLTNLVLDNLPDNYEDTKKWGQTRERWDGLKIRMKGLQVRTKRRKKEVNHGTWTRYNISLVDPDEHLLVKITDWQQRGIGTVGFNLNLAARVNVVGRRQRWNNGVRLFSATAEAVADVRLQIGMQISTRLDASKFPPDVILEPVAESAVAQLVQFKLQRISRADGPIVRELGDGLEKILRKKLAEKNEKLVQKINRQFEKKEDDLRLSVSDLVKHKWLGIDPPGEKERAPGK